MSVLLTELCIFAKKSKITAINEEYPIHYYNINNTDNCHML